MEEGEFYATVFEASEEYLNVPLYSTIKCSLVVENLQALVELDEIVFSLRNYIVSLNTGMWGYTFDIIKAFRGLKKHLVPLPARNDISMYTHYMQAYSKRIIHIAHKRGLMAIGGVSNFIPRKGQPELTEKAIKRVKYDKLREATQGYDGSWVAHPGLVKIGTSVYNNIIRSAYNQTHKLASSQDAVSLTDVLDFSVKNQDDEIDDVIHHDIVTKAGFVNNIRVCLRYYYNWFNGIGSFAMENLMEDASTAEICRAQLWFWVKNKK
jgi:malate synthase